jgi:hypothetical protein
MVKLMIVPYINQPPMMLMTAAAGSMSAQCAKRIGKAVPLLEYIWVVPILLIRSGWVPTNAHNDEEASQEASKVYDATAATLHEIIVVCCSSAEPVGHWCDHIGCHYEKWKVLLPQGGGEDDEEEADGEDLTSVSAQIRL